MDLRQEIVNINGGYDWYQSHLGEGVVWHEYASRDTTYNAVYDEGGRHYTAGVLLPVLWVIVSEDRANRTDAGRKPTETITLAISMMALSRSGISEPEDYTRRLNDVIRYDGRLWKVTDFNIRGRVPGSVIIGVIGTQIFTEEEMSFDTLPEGMTYFGSTRPYAYPNEEVTRTFPDHELPAPNGDDMSSGFYTNFDTSP